MIIMMKIIIEKDKYSIRERCISKLVINVEMKKKESEGLECAIDGRKLIISAIPGIIVLAQYCLDD